MKKVEILTANTISIQYETATLLHRGLALLIDIAIKIGYYLLILIFFTTFFSSYDLYENETPATIVFYFVIWAPLTFYTLVLEYLFKGQTIRKNDNGNTGGEFEWTKCKI